MPALRRALARLFGTTGPEQRMTPKNVILITGCDSGLGFSLASYCLNRLNMTVVSACHNLNSAGAQQLQQLARSEPKRLITIELDLLNAQTITHARQQVDALMHSNGGDYVLTALVNNAGVMCFGEFEWQTPDQFEMQINVNLLGTMRVTKALLPLIRQHRGRIINITSHCGLQALPSLSAYAASKAGLRFWNDALRIEMSQYGVEVVNFIPGSFVMSSNIAARQQEHATAMYDAFDEEQRNFYGPYFRTLNAYLTVLSGFKAPNQMHDEELLRKFQNALTARQPKALYIHEPFRYKMYRLLFRLCPTPITDWLTEKFCAMPTYEQVTGSK